MSLLRDEQGSYSSARCALWVTLLVTLCLIGLDASPLPWGVPQAAYALLGGAITVFAAWAGGPRVAQYIAPQIGAFAKSIGDARESAARAVRGDEG